ncbi:MAG: chromosome segregation protein SMC [Candidatus Methanomethylophilaceae archaeon]|nr:chromosome segregation protein SMC [Candidatus Methanomethylophilaceae archaeon]
MYLKQVEMENFKSFGGKLTVPLTEGYTAVTGPNGSGKSNITDAILFVLGPRSSKAVRAGKITDLIFDGGRSKGKAGHMKVSLVFDNTDRLMPWDDDTVRLTRYVRLNDNGVDYTSQFFVNDRKSTMSEFDSLLTKARISAEGYNLVQQGDVTRIVQMGSAERRRILDGISGIASFDADIDHASGERQDAQSNLDRVMIVVEEISSELVRLEKDREDARRYLQAKADLDTAKAQMSVRRLQLEQAKLDSVTEQMSKTADSITVLVSGRKELQEALNAKEDEIRSVEKDIESKVGPEYRELKDKIEQTKVDLATARDRRETAESDLESQEAYRTNFEEYISENKLSIEGMRTTRAELETRLEGCNVRKADLEREEKEVSELISSAGGETRQVQDALEKVDADIVVHNGLLVEAQGRLSKAESESEEAHRAFAESDEALQNADFEIKDLDWRLAQLKQEVGPDTAEFGSKILEAKGREAALEREEKDLDAVYRRIDSEYNSLQAEKKVSERVNRGRAAVDSVLALRDRGEIRGIHGAIWELATVDKGYENALSVAAGGKMQAVVVEDDQVAADVISYLKKERMGRVTCLPLNKMRGGKPGAKALMAQNDCIGFAIDLIQFDEKYYNAFWYALGDTLVVSDMNTARRLMGGIRMVTVQGELVEASGAMTGGTLDQQRMLKFGAASEDRLSEVGEKLRKATAALEDVRYKLRQVREEIRQYDDELRKISSSTITQREEMAQLKGKKEQLSRSRKAASDNLAACRTRVQDADAELEAATSNFSDVSAKLSELNAERAKLRDRLMEIAPEDLQNRINAVREGLHQVRGEIGDITVQIGTIDAEISGLNKQNESYQMQLDGVLATMEEDRAAIAQNKEQAERLEIDLKALRSIESDMESGLSDLRNRKDVLNGERYRIESDIRDNERESETRRALLESHRAQFAMLTASVEECRAEVDAITIEVPEPVPSEEECKRRIRACENTMESIGNVNLRAIDDYDEKKARYDGLMVEVDSLQKHIAELSELMDNLGSKKKGLFMEAYDSVNVNFKKIYEELSGGGEAFMNLENEDDPFAGGLQINAKPRNGKLLRLESLSGGEKSLTALSFIFAIQEYQPSPFYVLDEVDMFLDSVNAEMVAKRVRESSAKAQFIQVSLRKVTLALADHLIGVTRPPSGISRVIMQPDLAEVSRYEAQAGENKEGA